MSVRRQHVVSQVLLRRWSEDGLLRAVNLRRGTVASRAPRAAAFVPWFVDRNHSDPLERVWKEVEDGVADVLVHVANGTVFEHSDCLDLLRQVFAVHFVRAKHIRLTWTELLDDQMRHGRLAEIREMLSSERVLAALYEHQTGLVPVSPGQLLVARDAVIADLQRRFDPGGEAFVEQILEQYCRVVDFVRARPGIEIGLAGKHRLIIGDNPAATYDSNRRTAGIHDGVPLTAADALILPLTPQHLLAIGGQNRFVDLNRRAVDLVNQIQLVSAVDSVYLQPSARALESWVFGERLAFLRHGCGPADRVS